MSVPRTFAKLEDPMWNRLHGGSGGKPFNDALSNGDRVKSLWIAAGSLIDSVQIAYSNGNRTSRHGGMGGTGTWTHFEQDESILEISGYTDRHVCFLAIRTTHRLIEAGKPLLQAKPFAIRAPEGTHIIGLHGRCAHYLDAVGARIAPIPPPKHHPSDLARAQLDQMGPVHFISDKRGRGASTP